MTDRPRYDLVRTHGGTVAGLIAAMNAEPDLRAAVEKEVALLEDKTNTLGFGAIIDRCMSARDYVIQLRKALGDDTA
jgi:hypothetical protein